MKQIMKNLIVGMLMFLLCGLSTQAAVKSLSIQSPANDSAVWVGYGAKSVPVKVRVSATGSTSKELRYKSSNTKIAAVSSKGVVTGKKAGKVTITITAKADSKKYVKLNLQVKQKVASVSVSKKTISMYIGSNTKLKPKALPAKSSFTRFVFESINPQVASVGKDGTVTAKKAGSTRIRITSRDGYSNGRDAYVDVQVNVKQRYVSYIVPEEPTIKMGIGGTDQINVKVSPSTATNKKMVYKSSNTKIAKVSSSGKVTAVGNGTATITITAADGSKKTAKVTVKVSQTVKVQSVVLKLSRTQLTAEGARTRAKFTVKPSNATIKSEKLTSSNKKVAEVSQDGWVIPKSGGTAKITYTLTDGTGRVKTSSVTVTVIQPVKGVTLSPASMTLYIGGGSNTGKLTAAVSPSDATNKSVVFASSNSSVAAVAADGTVTAKGIGSAVVTATTVSGKKIAQSAITVKSQEVLIVGKQSIGNTVSLNVNGSMTWENANAVSEFNRLMSDLIRLGGSRIPERVKDFYVGFNSMTYHVQMTSAGFKLYNQAGQEVPFEKFNGKEFGTVQLTFNSGATSDDSDKLLSGLNYALNLLNGQYKLGNLTIQRMNTTYRLTDVTLENGIFSFGINGKSATVQLNSANELVITNASEISQLLLDVLNGLMIKK